ncbi:MAG: hypothetical protein KAI24_04840 [Planctomycetes bacterium]|nr:hypothetical protein [Planctomycetota bacterium]
MKQRRRDLERASERLLDASLAEVFGGRRAGPAATPGAAALPRPARSRQPWLAAAVALLAIATVVASALWSRDDDARQATGTPPERQDPQPAPIPEPVPCRSPDELRTIDPATQSLLFVVRDPADLAGLARLSALRELILLNPADVDRQPWHELHERPDALQAIGGLARLERLQLPAQMHPSAAHVRSLAGAARLRFLQLPERTPASDELAAALAALPSLRELRLSHVTILPGFLRALAPCGLSRLELNACPVPQPAAYAELAALDTVRHLAVRFLLGYSEKLPAIGTPAFEAFKRMAALEDLDLDETNFEDRFMRLLPVGLKRLRLGFHVMTPSTIADLKRLADLEELIFHHGTHHAAAVDLLGALRLKEVFLHGWTDASVLRAIAGHPTIERVTLRLRGQLDLASLAQARRLRRLHLRFGQGLMLEHEPDDRALQVLRDAGIEVSVEREG